HEGVWRCVDSDVMQGAEDGKAIGVQGTVKLQNWDLTFTPYTDKCTNDQTLLEYFCQGKSVQSQTIPCAHGCKEGRCQINTDTTTCTESDGGFNEFLRGTAQTREPLSKIASGTDECLDARRLKEYSCVKGQVISTETVDCQNGCRDGACVKGNVELRDGDTFCRDSDGGYVMTTKGTLTVHDSNGKNTTQEDNCMSNGWLNEYRCTAPGEYTTFVEPCPNGCQDGACLPSASTTSSASFSSDSFPGADYERDVNQTVPFSDVDPLTEDGRAAIYLYNEQIAGGFPDGQFKGDRLVNRAEASKFVLNAIGAEVPTYLRNGGMFRDVFEDAWYTRFVRKAADLGIITGDEGKQTFRPGDGVNTAEFLAILSRAFKLDTNLPHQFTDVSENDWFSPYAGIAWKYQLFPNRGSSLQAGKTLNRYEVAVAIMKLREALQ
ncbi:MAG: S-layer homology domain-containing protein, partial [Candidatus Peribacteraceae bacterium]|nr:S-layer homology domain-containing protein [Candidatus Peribacteraceae bacterium]